MALMCHFNMRRGAEKVAVGCKAVQPEHKHIAGGINCLTQLVTQQVRSSSCGQSTRGCGLWFVAEKHLTRCECERRLRRPASGYI